MLLACCVPALRDWSLKAKAQAWLQLSSLTQSGMLWWIPPCLELGSDTLPSKTHDDITKLTRPRGQWFWLNVFSESVAGFNPHPREVIPFSTRGQCPSKFELKRTSLRDWPSSHQWLTICGVKAKCIDARQRSNAPLPWPFGHAFILMVLLPPIVQVYDSTQRIQIH